MTTLLMCLAACAMVATAAYSQYRVPAFTEGSHKVLLTRTVLIATGIALGFLGAQSFPNDPLLAVFAFLIGFGTVHVPAAFILFVKQERGAGRS